MLPEVERQGLRGIARELRALVASPAVEGGRDSRPPSTRSGY